ncbi:hypothetical protein J3R83DRAFT_7550 [Lanmaoa asiatica]|nr:hypothetical protein J3R83DRAFT_7550 [Lanmaoa asiatica]
MHIAGDVNNVATVYGSILLGTCFACGLTGIVFVQCLMYYKLYPGDFVWTKVLVFTVWAFDWMHTVCIVTAVWQSVITGFNKPEGLDVIPSFFANRIRMLTKKWYLAAPLVFLAFLRLFAACVSTGEIIHLKRYSLFIKPYPSWVFTMGVTLSASVEFIITTVMIIFLGSRKTGFANMNHIINTLILYTLETGGITWYVCLNYSTLFWLLMRHNLIFLGMHFTIAKRIQILSRLNTRKRLRVDRMYSSEREHNNGLTPLPSPINKSHFSVRGSSMSFGTAWSNCILINDLQQNRMLGPTATQKSVQLNVNVETTIVSQIDEDKDHCDIEATPTSTPTLAAYDQDGKYTSLDRDSSDTRDEKYYPYCMM